MADYKLPLPIVTDPDKRRCVTIKIPDDIGHIRAFWGFIRALGYEYSWERDAAHRAKDVAAVWRAIYFAARDAFDRHECGQGPGATTEMQLRQNGCVLEYSIDCETWSVLYDPRLCPDLTTQPGPQDTPDLNECTEYVVTLRGNETWLLPVVVGQGYTIEVSELSGGWNDGSTVFTWYCPDGHIYSLGNCAGGQNLNENDPLPTAYHMQLIGRLEGGSYFDPLGGPYTVPNGTSDKFVLFQANDTELSNNSGSVNFKVRVCHGIAQNPYAPGQYIWAPNMPGWTIVKGTVVDDHIESDENKEIVVDFGFDDNHAYTTTSPQQQFTWHHDENGVHRIQTFPVVNGVPGSPGQNYQEFMPAGTTSGTGYMGPQYSDVNAVRFSFTQVDGWCKDFEVNVA